MAGVFLLALLALVACAKTGLVGMALWFNASCPQMAVRALDFYQGRARRCCLVGLINLVAGGLLALVLIGTGGLAFLGILLLLGMGVIKVLAFATVYRHVGARLFTEGDLPVLRRVLLGGLVAEAAFLTPILGQLLNVGLLVRGFGAVSLALLSARRNRMDTADQTPRPAQPG